MGLAAGPSRPPAARQVGDAVHRRVQPASSASRLARSRVVGVDHHGVEERIHRRPSARQAQRRRCSRPPRTAASARRHRSPAHRQPFARRPAQQRRVGRRRAILLALLQDVADALVGRGQRADSGRPRNARTASSRFGNSAQHGRARSPRRLDLLRRGRLAQDSRPGARAGTRQPRPAPGRRPAEGGERNRHQVRQFQRQLALDQHADHAQRVRRSANGSLSPVGSWPMPNRPASVSSLSASATTRPDLRCAAARRRRSAACSGPRWRRRCLRPGRRGARSSRP